MIRVGERFSFYKELLDKHDQPSREALKYHISQSFKNKRKKISVIDNPDIFGPDMIICVNNKPTKHYIELFHNAGWVGEQYPYKALNITQKKGRDCLNMIVDTIVFNNDFTMMAYVKHKYIKECVDLGELFEIKSWYMKKNEWMYKLDKKYLIFSKVKMDYSKQFFNE